MSLRKIAAELAAAGHVTSAYRNRGNGSGHADREAGAGRPFNPATIRAMIQDPHRLRALELNHKISPKEQEL